MNLIHYRIPRPHWTGYYYSRLLHILCKNLIQGFFSQQYLVWLFFENWQLLPLVRLLKTMSIVRLQALLDIAVTDNPVAADGRFGLLYSFWCYQRGLRFFLKTFTTSALPVQSLSDIFPSANWLEREAWDLFGVRFLNHSDLRRILTDYGFRGHPLRKDFPLMGYLEIRYEDNFRSLVFEPVELSQEFRLFKFEMPWALWPTK
jgi:NADH-quinone oxidoreductase subunit C